MQLVKISAFFLLAFICISHVTAGPVEKKEDVFKVYNEELAKKLELAVKEISTEIKGSISRLSEKFTETFEKVTKIVKDFFEHADLAGTVKKLVEVFSSTLKEASVEVGDVLKKTVKEEYDRSLLKIKEVDIAGSLSDFLKKAEKELQHLIEVANTQSEKLLKESREICKKLREDPRYKEYEKEIKALEEKFIESIEKLAKSLGFKQPIGETLRDLLEKLRNIRKSIEKSIDEKLLKA